MEREVEYRQYERPPRFSDIYHAGLQDEVLDIRVRRSELEQVLRGLARNELSLEDAFRFLGVEPEWGREYRKGVS